jgi:hypothetical protein
MAVDPYSPCPCGSGQKFKWCCHKVESFAERAQRLYEGGQAELAIEAIDEGLRKEPGNAWLLTRKALYLIGHGEVDAAKASLRLVFERSPKHLGAHMLLARLVLETEGGVAGAAQFQRTAAAILPESRQTLGNLASVVASLLGEEGQLASALAHSRLAARLLGPNDTTTAAPLRSLQMNPTASAWLKNPYELAAPPEGLSAAAHEQFSQGLKLVEDGLWTAAATAFERVSRELRQGSAADYNLGLCRLWLSDNNGAVVALRRYVATLGETTEAVDLEALCQQIATLGRDDQVEEVQLIWPLRDRAGLLKTLQGNPHISEEGQGPIDEDDPNSPEVDHFSLLDRPRLDSPRPGLKFEEIPRNVAHILVGQEIVALETFDDGRLDTLVDRFTALAGAAIPPAHPRTKVIDKVSRTALALSWDWLLPEGLDRDELRRLSREQGAWSIRETWPRTPMPFLGGRTPQRAAKDGNSAVPLRAAIVQLEQSREVWRDAVDFAAMRATLRIADEPAIDPATVEIGRLPLARLDRVPVEGLSDEKLVELYRRAREFMVTGPMERAARALIDRRPTWENVGIEPLVLYSDLSMLASGRAQVDEAFEWMKRGRQAENAAQRAKNAVVWDMLEIRLRSHTEAPESWVPALAVVLDRYGEDHVASQAILMNLIEMGIVRLVPNPDNPEQVSLDTRGLQMILAEYGPRVTTASGQLGVSATKPEIWTPGAKTGGGGGIWTPGASASAPPAQGGDKPKLIIPGR